MASPHFGEEELAAADSVLRSGAVVQGPEVEAFEKEFASLATPGSTAIAVNSGTSALHLGLLAAGVGPGDEVIVPTFTFAATANAVALTGATPVFADVRVDDFGIDPDSVRSLISPRTTAVIAVHLFGQIGVFDQLRQLTDSRGLMLIEDAAQAHLAEINGSQAGTLGTFGAFSFYPTKNMTTGEGGMVTTTDESLVEKVRLLRNQGQVERYRNLIPGFNNRMTDVSAAIGRVQLKSLLSRTLQRRANAAFYDSCLPDLLTPKEMSGRYHVYHQYTLRIPARDRPEVQRALERLGVETQVYYPIPVHRLPAYARSENLPVAQAIAEEVLSIPVHPGLSVADLHHVANALIDTLRA